MTPSCVLYPVGGGPGHPVRVQPFPVPAIVTGIEWSEVRRAQNGERYGIDRGAERDIYTAEVVFFGTAAEMNAVGDWLDMYGRGMLKMANIDGHIFPPDVDQSGEITVAVIGRDEEQRVFASPTEQGVHILPMTLRLVSPSFIDVAPSLDGIVLQPESMTPDKVTDISVVFSEAGDPVVVDYDQDAGLFAADFMQGPEETAAAIRFLLATARAGSFDLPIFPTVTYPFGAARGGYPKRAKCIGMTVARHSLDYWMLRLTLAESFE